MPYVVLNHEGRVIPLLPGDTIVGRAIECRIRFNDPAVSRQHLLLVVRGKAVVAQNLSRSNGTLLNGVPLTAPAALATGDVVRIGHCKLLVELVDDRRARAPSAAPVASSGREVEPGSGIFVDDDEAADEATRPGNLDGSPLASSLTQALADGAREQTCPRCQARSSQLAGRCPRCAYAWPAGRPNSPTQEVVASQVVVRAHPRYAVEVPVAYSSETLGIDALVRDLSRGGMFIATDLLDPIGTACELTALPDGHPAVRFTGVVAHVVHQSNEQGRPPGLGIRFVGPSTEALAWIEQVLAGFATATAASSRGDETIDLAGPELDGIDGA